MKKFLVGLGLVAALFALAVVSATLTVNLGSRGEEVTVPDLRGSGIVPAIETLEKLGLNLKINGKEYSEKLPVGAIISHEPPAGNMVRRGRSVEAIISVGPGRVTVPDVRANFALQAQSILLESGLKIGRLAKIPVSRSPLDTVIGQNPEPPAVVDKNTPVDLLISTGAPAVVYVMPDFIGRPLRETISLVQEAGLEISQVTYRDYPGAAQGTVISQKPLLGTPVGRGGPIELVVARERASGARGSRYSLLSFYVPEGFRARKVRVVIESESSSYEALNENRPAGDLVQVLVEVSGRTRAMIYVDGSLQDTKFF